MKKTCIIDGTRFRSLRGFFREVGREIVPGYQWGRNLNAFNDILRGGFGTPDDGFIIVWKNSDVSRQRLGIGFTLRRLRIQQILSLGMNWRYFREEIGKIHRNNGPYLFDTIVEIIRDHGPEGREPEDGIELRLEQGS